MSSVSAAGTTGTTTSSTGSGPQLSADLGTFLTLLTTQLRNQDPMQPMDANTLTQQLVQFASVEQQILSNQLLEQMLGVQQAGQLADAAQLIGRRVTVESNTLPLQDGKAELILPAAGSVVTARVHIADATGSVIYTKDVTLGTGQTTWQWDGVDAQGVQRPDGAYIAIVTGSAADGTSVTISPLVTGVVTGAGRVNGDPVLRLGAATVKFDALRDLPGAS